MANNNQPFQGCCPLTPIPKPIKQFPARGPQGPPGPPGTSCIRTDPENGCSVAEGNATTATGFASHAEGDTTLAQGRAAHAEGCNNQAIGDCSHAEGDPTKAIGTASHAEGSNTGAVGDASHSEGNTTIANANTSHAEGLNSTAGTSMTVGIASHAEGQSTKTEADNAHAEGFNTVARGISSHAEGEGNTARERASHVEGGAVDPLGNLAPNLASGQSSHAEGVGTIASGFASHAEGGTSDISSNPGPQALGDFSHAEGLNTTASEVASHAEGAFTSTAGFANSHIMGVFGDVTEANSWFIGNGTSNLARGLGAKWLASNGEMFIDGAAYNTGGADFAEMFETADGNRIDVGYFVTLEEDKIRIATSSDNYILGISSATPSLIGNSAELSWHGRYLLDEWGRRTYHEVKVPTVKDRDGNKISPERSEIQPVMNPEWDPQREYIPRKKRPEWVPVGLIGKILVRDDGTCEVNGYCKPNHEGMATKADKGYRVLKRTGPNQVLVLLNSTLETITNIEQLKQLESDQKSVEEMERLINLKEKAIEQLERLAKLRDQGILTEEEFQIEKKKLLNL